MVVIEYCMQYPVSRFSSFIIYVIEKKSTKKSCVYELEQEKVNNCFQGTKKDSYNCFCETYVVYAQKYWQYLLE